MSAPLGREPQRVRPPYDVPDRQFEHLMASDPEAWRRALHLDRLAALLEPLAGVAVSDYERTILEWLTGWDVATVGTVSALLFRAREAAPLTATTDTGSTR